MTYYREVALAAYGAECFACGAADGEIEVHHIKGASGGSRTDDDNQLDNLVPLCVTCHSRLHHAKEIENDRLRRLRDVRDAHERRRRERVMTDGGSKTVTFKLDPELVDDLDDEADEAGVSRSEYLRNIIESRHDTDELEAEIEDLENRIEDLRNQLASANTRIDAANEIVEYVEEERTVERHRRHAGLLTRAKWWVTGMPADVQP